MIGNQALTDNANKKRDLDVCSCLWAISWLTCARICFEAIARLQGVTALYQAMNTRLDIPLILTWFPLGRHISWLLWLNRELNTHCCARCPRLAELQSYLHVRISDLPLASVSVVFNLQGILPLINLISIYISLSRPPKPQANAWQSRM